MSYAGGSSNRCGHKRCWRGPQSLGDTGFLVSHVGRLLAETGLVLFSSAWSRENAIIAALIAAELVLWQRAPTGSRRMIGGNDTPFRLIVAAELVALVGVRAYYSFFRSREPIRKRLRDGPEVMWLTATLGIRAMLHFGAVLTYVAWPSALAWSVVSVGEPIRWVAIVISCAGAAGEIWAAISLGASYSPLLRVGRGQVLVTAGAYRWIRHPLYSFGLPLMAGWGVAACNWFITATGTFVILLAIVLRAPREEAMMLGAFGESYREYMTRTGRFVPRLPCARG